MNLLTVEMIVDHWEYSTSEKWERLGTAEIDSADFSRSLPSFYRTAFFERLT